VATSRAVPAPRYTDDLHELLLTQLDDLVAEYLPTAVEHGTSEAQLLEWLTSEEYLGYQAVADLNGVEVTTLRRWVWTSNKADAAGTPYTSACYIKPDIVEGSKTRLWWEPRVLLYGWRTGRITAGTRTATKRTPPGAPRNQQRAAKQAAAPE